MKDILQVTWGKNPLDKRLCLTSEWTTPFYLIISVNTFRADFVEIAAQGFPSIGFWLHKEVWYNLEGKGYFVTCGGILFLGRNKF